MNDRDYLCRYGGFRPQRPEDMSNPWARPAYTGADATTADVRPAPSQMYAAQNLDVFPMGMQPPLLGPPASLSHGAQDLSGHHQMMAVLGLQPQPTHQPQVPEPRESNNSNNNANNNSNNSAPQGIRNAVQSAVSTVFQDEKAGPAAPRSIPGLKKRRKNRNDPSKFKMVGRNKKLKRARAVQPIDCSKCRFHCSNNIPEDARQAIHDLYWGLGTYERQRAFIAQHVDQNEPKTSKAVTGNKREWANTFFLTHNRKEYRVCKAFFTKTLDIGSKVVDLTMRNTQGGVYVGTDGRGRGRPINKTKDEDIDFVKMHISSFGSMKKKDGKKKRKYLSADLNVQKMYSMYKSMCDEVGRKPLSLTMYRLVFKRDFNLAFAKPRREHCPGCNCESQKKKRLERKDNGTFASSEIQASSSSFSGF